MKHILTTTAVVLALGLPVSGLAQTADPAATTQGFLAARGLHDRLATDLIGQDVYARRAPLDGAGATTAVDGQLMLVAADLDAMDNVGKINDLVLSSDGKLAAIVVGIGGFLGVGEQDVAVTLDQVRFATRSDEDHAMVVVIGTTADMLKASPKFDRLAALASAEGTMTDAGAARPADRMLLTAPAMERDGYRRALATDVSVDALIGKAVYGINDREVGTVSDVIVDDAGAVRDVVIDFGGFLGIGTSKVALGFDELTLLARDGNADIRVYVDATKEQIQALPPYTATN